MSNLGRAPGRRHWPVREAPPARPAGRAPRPPPDGMVSPDQTRDASREPTGPPHRLTACPIVSDVAARLPKAETVLDACQETVATLGRHAPVTVAVLLRVHDRLRCVAATGSWQVFSTVAPEVGVVGRVYTAGRTELVGDVSRDPDYLPLRPDVTAELCTPVPDPTGRPIGVLDLQWVGEPDLTPWREVAEEVAALLGARINQLGGPPAESRSEKLLRHAAALTTAPTEPELLTAALAAARDVSGLAAAVLVLAADNASTASPAEAAPPSTHTPQSTPTPQSAPATPGPTPGTTGGDSLIIPRPRIAGGGARLAAPTGVPGTLEARVRAGLVAAGPAALHRLISQGHRYGAAYTLGEAQPPATADHATLVAAGVGTLIAVPVGPADGGGVLLVADERRLRPDPTTVNLVELLAAQSWICLERLRGLVALRQRASSDPLTGLRHHGSFGERIAVATPGRTALLAIDVDGFKTVNDTYGHQVGDQVLIDLARALERELRQGDELYRIGGDEFVAVVEVSRAEEAVGIGERLTAAARGIGRTVSVGVALQRDGEPPDLTLRRADSALYAVKRSGRDGVRLAAP